ncbi:MAG: efflux RND transporter periplasmic adaptor subunit [Planctomycetaceae bacterium]
MRRFLALAIGIPVCIGVGYFVYQDAQSRSQAPQKKKASNAIAVQVTRVEKRTISETINLVGRIQANAEITVRARVAGYIKRLPKDEGDQIFAGKLAVQLDNSQHEQAVDKSEASLKIAKAQLKAANARKTQASKEVVRYRDLKNKGGGTEQELEAAESQLAIASAEVELAESRVEAAESDLKQANLSLKETEILSTLTGYVAERLVEVGDLANPNDPLLKIVELNKVRLVASVIERDYEKIRNGQIVKIWVEAFPDREFSGRIIRKAPVIDPETLSAEVHVEIENPQILLKPGMSARAKIVLRKRENTPVVPVASLLERNGKTTLYVVEGKPPQTRLHEVRVGIRDGELAEILGGLNPDDRIVTLGSRLVDQGQEVLPVEVPMMKTLNSTSPQRVATQTGE